MPAVPQLPEPSIVLAAIDAYLAHAYIGSAYPAAVQAMLGGLRSRGPGDFYAPPLFVRSGEPPAAPRYSLRLGNRLYPHMKLVLEPAPDGSGYLFRADTHDRHIWLPSGHPERAAFGELVRENQKLAEAIEAAWEMAGLPTFRSFLRADLARRRQEP